MEGGKIMSEKYESIENGLHAIAKAIKPVGVLAGHDEYGGRVESLLEAVMGVPAGLKDVADAIRSHGDDTRLIAKAIRDQGRKKNAR